MASVGKVHIRVVLENPKAIRALGTAAQAVVSALEDRPWDDDLKLAAKALRYAIRHLRPQQQR